MMTEQRKAERVRVLGVQVDSIRVERAVHLTIRYLEKHKLEYIVFADTPAALVGKEENAYGAYLDGAALVLPGDRNIEDAVEVRQWLPEDRSYQAEYFRRLLARLNKHRGSIYLMVENENQLSKIRNIIGEKYNRLQKEDILWQQDTSIDGMVNAINSLAPDVLFICARHEKISQFLAEHACKINAGICFCMEEVVTDTETAVSDWIEASRFQKIIMETTSKISHFFHDFLFKKQMKKTQQEDIAEKTADEREEENR